MNRTNLFIIFMLFLTSSLCAMDAPQDEDLGAGLINANTLSKMLGALFTNKEIKITGTSTASSFYFCPYDDAIADCTGRPFDHLEEKKQPTQWKHDYTISFVDKKKYTAIPSAQTSKKADSNSSDSNSDEYPDATEITK